MSIAFYVALFFSSVSLAITLKPIRLPCTIETINLEPPSLCSIVLDGNISDAKQFRASQSLKKNPQLNIISIDSKPADQITPPPDNAKETVYKLGQGQAGGEVFLVVPWDPKYPKFVRKNYFTEDGLFNDLRGFDFLNSLQLKGLSVVQILQQTSSKSLQLSYVEGQTLNATLIDPRVPESTKSKLRFRFLLILNQLQTNLKNHPQVTTLEQLTIPDLEGASGALKFEIKALSPTNDQTFVHLIIKSDNIIVDKQTGDLVLIDPF